MRYCRGWKLTFSRGGSRFAGVSKAILGGPGFGNWIRNVSVGFLSWLCPAPHVYTPMDEPEEDSLTELADQTEKRYSSFRKGERKQMIDTLHDLIEESGKRATSQYTPSKERVRWVKLTGQLIWYKDHVLRNYDFERLAIEIQELKQRLDDYDKNEGSVAPVTPLPTWRKPQQEPEQEKKPEDKQPEKTEEREQGLYPESE